MQIFIKGIFPKHLIESCVMGFVVLNILYLIGGFLCMEKFSCSIHNYFIHRISFFEWNDLFFLLFAGIAIWLIFSGLRNHGSGLSPAFVFALYGMGYFIIQNVIVYGFKKWIYQTSNHHNITMRADKSHHRHLECNGAESFGLLWVNKRYFK